MRERRGKCQDQGRPGEARHGAIYSNRWANVRLSLPLAYAGWGVLKHQVPSTNLQRNFKLQYAVAGSLRDQVKGWLLVFSWCLVLGIWSFLQKAGYLPAF